MYYKLHWKLDPISAKSWIKVMGYVGSVWCLHRTYSSSHFVSNPTLLIALVICTMSYTFINIKKTYQWISILISYGVSVTESCGIFKALESSARHVAWIPCIHGTPCFIDFVHLVLNLKNNVKLIYIYMPTNSLTNYICWHFCSNKWTKKWCLEMYVLLK